jgi:hypothetical protein
MLHSMLAGCLGFSHSIATWCLTILMCCVCCNSHNVLHAHASFMLSILMLAQSECRYMLAHHTQEQELLPHALTIHKERLSLVHFLLHVCNCTFVLDCIWLKLLASPPIALVV